MTARTIAILFAAGLVVRLLLVMTSVGTSDVIFWILWTNLVEKHGIAGAYAISAMLNHAPLTVALLAAYREISTATGVEVTDLLRLVQVLADCVSFAALLAIGRRIQPANAAWLALYYFLSPVAIAITAFHCNVDATMVMFILVALALFIREQHAGAGVALALAFASKIPAIFLLPFLLVAAGRAWWRFLAAFSAVTLAIWTPLLAAGGSVVLRNIFGWAGMSGSWGLPAIANQLGWDSLARFYVAHGRWILLAALAVLGLLFIGRQAPSPVRTGEAPVLHGGSEWRGKRDVLRVSPLIYLALLFFAPGFGIQYLLWPLPFIPFLFERRSALLWSAITSIFVVVIYTYWSGGFPWGFADAMAVRPDAARMLPLIHAMWVTIGAFLAAGTGRWLRIQSRP